MRSLCSQMVTIWATFSSSVIRLRRSSTRAGIGRDASLYSAFAGWARRCSACDVAGSTTAAPSNANASNARRFPVAISPRFLISISPCAAMRACPAWSGANVIALPLIGGGSALRQPPSFHERLPSASQLHMPSQGERLMRSTRRRQGSATVQDVAREAGVSAMTVSRVVNGGSNVREATRIAVREAIDKLNYRPNAAARHLAAGEATQIGLLHSNPSAVYLSQFLIGALAGARRAGCHLVLEACEGESADEQAE